MKQAKVADFSTRAARVLGVCVVSMALACSSAKQTAESGMSGAGTAAVPASSAPARSGAAGSAPAVQSAPVTSGSAPVAGSAASVSGGAAGAPAGAASQGSLPCDVSQVLQQHCLMCHDKVTQFGAPLSLASYDDLSAMSKSKPGVPVSQVLLERVKDAQRPMPPQPMKALSADEIATLEKWVSGGKPKGDGKACSAAPAGAAADSGAAGAATSSENDPDVQCYKFLANDNGKQKYAVPTTPDSYQCFYFDAPWGKDDVQAVSANYVVDNTRAIHHFILYSTSSTAPANSNASCPSGAHPDGQFVVGWAPGATPIKMPADVGLEVPGPRYLIEAHYNAPEAGLTDASGIELCVTKKKRANAAATHPLGQEGFSSTGPMDVSGTCKPQGPYPIHILWSNPHMHLKGTRMQFIVHRKDGSKETLLDKPFDFMNQALYDTPAVINEGDTLETVCSFNGAMQFGTGTNQEMCYNFVTAWPAGALAGGMGYHGLSDNGNICINSLFGL